MRRERGGRGPEGVLATWGCVACLLAGSATRTDAEDGGRRAITAPTPSRGWEDSVPELERARAGARQRLSDARCEAVLADFTDVAGRRLDRVLQASGRSPQAQLDRLAFESGVGRYGCSSGQLAFTRIGSTDVSICVRPFTLLPPPQREAVLIHEMLHSLGLGENPPESAEVTARVLKRCGH
jgi:hypothetical protein